MAATVAEIREGLRANLAAVFEPSATVSAYALEAPVPPVLHITSIDQVTYDRAFVRGLDEWTFTLQGLGGPMSKGAQMVLDGWLAPTGSGSVKTAIEADRTLGGKVQTLSVPGASDYRLFKLTDATVMLGVEWQVRVFNRGT